MGESATLRRETGYQTSECKGRKASAPSQRESHVEQVAKDNESEGVYVRVVMENRPTLANACHKQAQAGPKKGGGLRAIHITRCMVSTPQKTRRKARTYGT
jgi:hypothetical protein